jgi:predicted transcriptional regulator
MGRPRIYDEPRIATAIRLPTSLRDELQEAATARDVSVNFLVTRAVADYLRRLPPPGEWFDTAAGAPRRGRRAAERTAS